MKLGLVRHFKVNQTVDETLLSPSQFNQIMKEYDYCPVIPNGLKIKSEDWDICFCSSLPRAVTTAEAIYNREIVKTDLLKEVPITPFTNWRIKLPVSLWHVGARIAWYKSHKSQVEGIEETRARIHKTYDLIVKSGHDNVLIVAHGYFLHMFYRELKKMGFNGEIDLNIPNAKLFVIEN